MGDSDKVQDDRALVSFLYDLMRDHVTPGVVEKLVLASPPGMTKFTNGYLANYAKELAARLQLPAAGVAAEQVQGNKS